MTSNPACGSEQDVPKVHKLALQFKSSVGQAMAV